MPLSLLPRDVAIVTHVALMPQSKKIDDPACGVIYPILFYQVDYLSNSTTVP